MRGSRREAWSRRPDAEGGRTSSPWVAAALAEVVNPLDPGGGLQLRDAHDACLCVLRRSGLVGFAAEVAVPGLVVYEEGFRNGWLLLPVTGSVVGATDEGEGPG